MELIVVIVVLAIIAVVVTPKTPTKEPYQVDGFAKVFIQDLRFTQVLAMSQNQKYRIEVGTGSLQIKNAAGIAINNPETGSATFSYPAGVTIAMIANPTVLTPTVVYFNSLGKPYQSNGTTATSGDLIFTITAGTSTKTVTVTQRAGFIQ